MLNLTETAKDRVARFLADQAEQGVTALRIAGSIAEPRLWLVKESDIDEDDMRLDMDGFAVVLDPLSARQLDGATVDFVEGVMQSGFHVFMPSPTWDDPVLQKVQDLLDKRINPGVAGHGGRISLVKRDEDAIYINMEGGCQGCGAASVTLRQGVETMIMESVPEVKRVIDATDHAAGENPYYDPSEVGDSPIT